MDPRLLRTFLVVAEDGSFRGAADRLFLSQPTITGHVQALEREVGAELIDRGGRRARLTPAGERLLPYARRILALEAEAGEEIRAWRLRYEERVRVAVSIFVAASVLPGAVRSLLAERPRIDLVLRTGFSREVVQAVGAGEADLGLSRVPPPGQGVTGRQLLTEAVVPVAPASWGDIGLVEALAAHPLLTHNHPGYWDRLLAQLQALRVDFRAMEVRQVDVTRRLIEEGLGMSFLPVSAVSGNGKLRVLDPIAGLDLPETGTWALWPADRPLSSACQRLLDLVEGQ